MSETAQDTKDRRMLLHALTAALVVVPMLLATACRGGKTAEVAGPAATAEAGTPVVSRADALATLTAVSAGAPAATAPIGVEGSVPDPAGSAPGAMATVSAAQATANANLGIADVGGLVDQMVPLATFTPSRGAPDVSGRLLYVRSGRFFAAEAGKGPGEQVGGDEIAKVWAPPEDPGRAWGAPDGRHVAFFGGTDAELWIMEPDGKNARRATSANLPPDTFTASLLGQEQQVTIHPAIDYTFVLLAGAAAPLGVLTDDNSRHIRGEARLRIVHASALYRDTPIAVTRDGVEISGPIKFGQSSGDQRIDSGDVTLTLTDGSGREIATLPTFTAGDKELKTVFLYGSDELRAAQFAYEPSLPRSGNSRVRVFNAGDTPLDVQLGSGITLAKGLATGVLGTYVNVPTLMGVDARQDAELALYGLKQGEQPVAWSPDAGRIAFIGFGDGQADLYIAGPDVETRRVTNSADREANPVWSLDSAAVAWEVIDESVERHDVEVLAAGAAATPRRIDMLAIIQAMGWPASVPVKLPKGITWVDDTRLALYPQSEGPSGGIWLYDSSGDSLTQLFDRAITDVVYSAAAKQFVVAVKEPAGELVVVDLEGEQRTLASGSAYGPLWSPDGKLVSWVEGEVGSAAGWRIHVVRPDGSDDRVLTEWWPILQSEPPVPGPRAKRTWLDGGRLLAFTRAGRDYGAAERAGVMAGAKAGDDIENMWIVPTDGSKPPHQATDLTRVFYLRAPEPSTDGDTLALVGFSYLDRSQQLWTLPGDGGKPAKVDGGVRWSMWLP